MTPETETTTNYFWASARRHAIGDPTADSLFFNQVSEAFEEDRRILEAQQRSLSEGLDVWPCALTADAGAIQARRVLERLIDREQAPARQPPDSFADKTTSKRRSGGVFGERLSGPVHDLAGWHGARGLGDHFAIPHQNNAGIPETPSALAASGSASELSFNRRTSGSRVLAAAAKWGAIDLHGPHQGAQTSTKRAAPLVAL